MARHLRSHRDWLAVAGIVLAVAGVTLTAMAGTGSSPPVPDVPAANDAAAADPLTPSAGVARLSDELARPVGDLQVDTRPASPEPSGPLVLAASVPVSIDIPAIGVASVLGQVGVTAAGRLEVPSGEQYNDAAWYRHSATPGSAGPAVIVGHVDSAADGPSVFFLLGDLGPGDEVFVARADGTTAVFTVDRVGRYPKDAFPTPVVYGPTEHAGLRLITCGGVFDRDARSYVDNVVVFASLTGSVPPLSPVSDANDVFGTS